MNHKTIVFSTEAYTYMKEALLKRNPDYINGELAAKHFKDGESYHRIITDVDQQHIILIGGTISDKDTLELYDLAYGMVAQSCYSLTLLIPYFGYSTMERDVEPGEIVKAKTRADLLSSIPKATLNNRVILVDMHTDGNPFYFATAVHPKHVHATDIIKQACIDIAGTDFIFASADAGRSKRIETLANNFGVKAAFVYKHRVDEDTVELTGVNADVKGKHVIIYDDMVRSGSTVLQAAKAYLDAGAAKVSAVFTHGVFVGDAFYNLQASGLLHKVAVCNTHANAMKYHENDWYRVYDILPLINI